MYASFSWVYLDEQGKRIQNALHGLVEGDNMEAFSAWSEYLEKRLSFPLEAKVSEGQRLGPLQVGDLVKVTGIRDVEDMYGILVDV
jgi:hypothetical protein